ncbi:hypothetical protein KUTeg_022106, partial [Tegillarca granosa]
AGIIIELRFEKKVINDEKWKQEISQYIKVIKSSNKQLSKDIKDTKSSTKQLSQDIKDTKSSTKQLSQDIKDIKSSMRHVLSFWIWKGVGVELPFISRIVGVATQRRYSIQQWVTSYRVYYSEDCIKWELIGGGDGKVFAGNVEGDDIKKNFFNQPVKAKCIRVNPLTWYNHVSMRMDAIGCRI